MLKSKERRVLIFYRALLSTCVFSSEFSSATLLVHANGFLVPLAASGTRNPFDKVTKLKTEAKAMRVFFYFGGGNYNFVLSQCITLASFHTNPSVTSKHFNRLGSSAPAGDNKT